MKKTKQNNFLIKKKKKIHCTRWCSSTTFSTPVSPCRADECRAPVILDSRRGPTETAAGATVVERVDGARQNNCGGGDDVRALLHRDSARVRPPSAFCFTRHRVTDIAFRLGRRCPRLYGAVDRRAARPKQTGARRPVKCLARMPVIVSSRHSSCSLLPTSSLIRRRWAVGGRYSPRRQHQRIATRPARLGLSTLRRTATARPTTWRWRSGRVAHG